MLILTRKNQESIFIAPNILMGIEEPIQITVLEIRSNAVSIGVKASKEVVVHREEVYRQLFRNQKGIVCEKKGVKNL